MVLHVLLNSFVFMHIVFVLAPSSFDIHNIYLVVCKPFFSSYALFKRAACTITLIKPCTEFIVSDQQSKTKLFYSACMEPTVYATMHSSQILMNFDVFVFLQEGGELMSSGLPIFFLTPKVLFG